MYLDARLWRFTAGLRHRLFGAVGIGLLSAAVGVLRLVLLGWLLGEVFDGAGLGSCGPRSCWSAAPWSCVRPWNTAATWLPIVPRPGCR